MPARKPKLVGWQSGFLAGLLLVVAILPALCLTLQASADGLDNRSLQLLNDSPGTTTDYTISFTISNSSTIGSLDIQACSNSPLQGDSCTLPAGLDFTNAQLTAQTGITDFSLFVAATNDLVLSRPASPVTAPLTVTLTLHNVINPSATGSYYVRVSAYSSTNATGTAVDFGGLAFAIANNLQISSIVPPYLTFCTGVTISTFSCDSADGDYIDFGDLSASHSSQATSQMLVATNAANGYVIQIYGTTMTSGNNTIPAITSQAGSQPGSPQFGLNLRANTQPAVGSDPTGPGSGQPASAYNSPNRFQFVSNDTVVSSLTADNFRKYTASYIVNVATNQAPGVYVSTLTYVCAGSF